jgi:hypothetical protein
MNTRLVSILVTATLALCSLPLRAQDNPFPAGNRTVNGNLTVNGTVTATGTISSMQTPFTLISQLADGPIVGASTVYFVPVTGLAITNYLKYDYAAQYAMGGASGLWVSNFFGGITAMGGVLGTGPGNTTNLAAILFTNGVSTAMWWTNTDASGAGVWTNCSAASAAFYLTNGSTWAIEIVASAVLPGRTSMSFGIQGYRQ